MILVVDDNPGFSRIVGKTLTAAGYEVQLAPTAAEGLRLLTEDRAEPYELALIDYRLDGGVNGIEVARQAREAGSAVKFVLISGEIAEDGVAFTGLCLADFEQVIGKPMLATAMIEMANKYTGRNMSLPMPAEITEAASAAGIEVSPGLPPGPPQSSEDDGDG